MGAVEHQSSIKEKETRAQRAGAGGSWGTLEFSIVIGGVITLIVCMSLAYNYDQSARPDLFMNTDDPELVHAWQDHPVPITKLESAVELGAVCLDGSAPAYYLDRGSGEGADHWIIHLEGGGWCRTNAECLNRAFTQLGSSQYMADEMFMGGLLSSSPVVNPDFHNWNRVKFKYCDGGSFFGDVDEAPLVEQKLNNRRSAANVHYRGMRVFKAVMNDLLAKGMANAKKGFLTGCSAGGLAATLQCDNYKDLMPADATVKCLSDAGFFLHKEDIAGRKTIELFYQDVVALQNITVNLPKACTSERDPALCFFPKYLVPLIRTPFFLINPAYDDWQFSNIFVPSGADPSNAWAQCKMDLNTCDEKQIEIVQGFRTELLDQASSLLESSKGGAYINSCCGHCQTEMDRTWNGDAASRIQGKTMAEIVGEWFADDKSQVAVDCAFPCNPTCNKRSFH